MSQQGLNLRRSVQIVRRHKILVAALTALGLIAAVGYVILNPPKLTSQALLVLPSGGGANMSTQVVIVGSDPVLSGALRNVGHGVSLQTMRDDVHVSSLTANVIAVTAKSGSGAQAELMANSVANSYLQYLGAATNPFTHVRAKLLQDATTAGGSTFMKTIATDGIVGLLAGALVGFIAALAVGKNEKRLRERDDIANSIGVPVLASMPVEDPADAPAWTALLAAYEPGIVHAWRLRKALQQLGVADPAAAGSNGPVSVGVLSLASDSAALALGPHLAAYAASQGVPTVLVTGPQQDENVTAALRTACTVPLPASSERAGNLRLVASDDGNADVPPGARLIVAIAVIDAKAPRIPPMVRSVTTLLAVSAGAATAEDLARVATVAAGDGRDVTGILVADPDPSDRTTGRIPQLGGPTRRTTPTRVHGIPTESRR